MYYSGGHLKCSNALKRRETTCWNHVQLPAQLVREWVLASLLSYLEGAELYRTALVEVVWKLLERTDGGARRHQREAARELATLEKQAANLAQAIAAGGRLEALVEKLTTVESAIRTARRAAASERASASRADTLRTRKQVEQQLPDLLGNLARQSFEFADVLRQIIPEFILQPVQALDTPLVRPRGKLKVVWGRLLALAGRAPVASELPAETWLELDFFEAPAHIRAMPDCLRLKQTAPGLSLKKIAARLGLNHMTVKRALDYARRMGQAGLTEPYQELHAAPARASRWIARHKTPASRPN